MIWHTVSHLVDEVIPSDHFINSCLTGTADPGAVSTIQSRSYTFVEIDHEIIYTAMLLPSADSRSDTRRVVFSYKRRYVHEILVNCLVKLAQEKVWLGILTVPT